MHGLIAEARARGRQGQAFFDHVIVLGDQSAEAGFIMVATEYTGMGAKPPIVIEGGFRQSRAIGFGAEPALEADRQVLLDIGHGTTFKMIAATTLAIRTR